MKLVHKTLGWTVEGTPVARIAAGQVLNELEIFSYFGVGPTEPRYAEVAAPATVDRIGVMREDGTIVVVPLNDAVDIED